MYKDNEKCWLKDQQPRQCSQVDCDCFCLRYFKLNILFDYAMIPLKRRKRFPLKIDADGTDEKEFMLLSQIESNILDFVNKGQNLFISSSNVGNGKTSWALRLCSSYLNKIWVDAALECKVLFISVPDFLIELKKSLSAPSEYIKAIEGNIKTCDLVVWDDIANKKGTEFEIHQMFSIIEDRIANGKSNIYTTNLSGMNLAEALGDRLYSRVVNYSDYEIELKGMDKRKIKAE